jgi:tRNA 2-thiouridine synthesizing protein A
MADQELDARGLTCPLPVMRAAKLMLAMKAGQTLRVRASDPATVIDFDAYARGSGNALLESKKISEGEFEFLLKRAQ